MTIIKAIAGLERLGGEGEKSGNISGRLAAMERPENRHCEIKAMGRPRARQRRPSPGGARRGVRGCMGPPLARPEIKVALQEGLRRVPAFSVRPGTTIEYRPGGVVGPEHPPLVR